MSAGNDARGALRRFAGVSGAVVAAAGLAIIAAWRLGVQDIFTLVEGWPPIVANTAAMFAATGLALFLLARRRSGGSLLAARSLSFLALAAAAATAAEYAFNVDLRIDQLIAPAQVTDAMRIPGRPSPQTAAAFLFLAASLLIISRGEPGRKKLEVPSVLAAVVIAVVAILGHLFQLDARYGAPSIWPHNEMALLSAILLILLGGGVLAAQSENGVLVPIFGQSPGGIAARRLYLGLGLLAPWIVLVAVGVRQGWYSPSTATVIIVFSGAAEASVLILRTVRRLDALDVIRQRQEERIKQLLEQASDGIFIADLNGRYTDVNEAGLRMLGYASAGEIIGKTILDFIPPEQAQRLAEARLSLLKGGAQVSEWSMRRTDGSFLPVEVSAKILSDGRWQAIVRDISERLRVQRLREAVIAMTSHELGNPLTTISLALNMIARDAGYPKGSTQREIVELARGAARRMVRMISDFLTIEKLASGNIRFEIKDADLRSIVDEAVRSMRPIAEQAQVLLRLDPAGERVVVDTDADRITQVLVNLISNAIKFSPAGGRVDIDVRKRRGMARVAVADSGPGIPREFRERIFGRFERALDSTKEGSGLGLSISKAIIESLGGRIGFKDRLGGGTIFYFELKQGRVANEATCESLRSHH